MPVAALADQMLNEGALQIHALITFARNPVRRFTNC
jgi:hypothetical protein